MGSKWYKVGQSGGTPHHVSKEFSEAKGLNSHRLQHLIGLNEHSVMFIGEHSHSIDEKGRLQVPVKWRSKLAEGAVVTKGLDGSLKFYPMSRWTEIAAKLASLPQSHPQARAFVRQTLAGAVDVEIDKLGRVLLPQYLRDYAGLAKQTVLAGLVDHIEIWDAARWAKYQTSIDQSSPEFAEALKEIGI